MKHYLKITLAILIAFTLSGCGFRAMPKNPLSPKMRNLYIQSVDPYGQFTLGLKHSLKAGGTNIANNISKASCILELSAIEFSHTGSGIYSSAQANIYTFNLTVLFKIRNAKGENISGERSVTVSRQLTLSPDEVLETSNQVLTIKNEMQREVILKIFNILSSKQMRTL